MINYSKGAFGLNLLFRIHGSAIVKGLLPALLSVVTFLAIRLYWHFYQEDEDEEEVTMRHPYAVGVFVSSVTFLFIFRANFGYQRYWEACGFIYSFTSKWADAASQTTSFHMQCDHYRDMRPPTFYDYPDLKHGFYTRDRVHDGSGGIIYSDRGETPRSEDPRRKSIHVSGSERTMAGTVEKSYKDTRPLTAEAGEMIPLMGKPRLDGGWKELYGDGSATFYASMDSDSDQNYMGFASTAGGKAPPLFLQELIHLTSLLNAVALATLRDDTESAPSQLQGFHPGQVWPEIDRVDQLGCFCGKTRSSLAHQFLGIDRTPTERTKYNASRPLQVVGGVSDAEIYFIQMARGPAAKTQLCFQWLVEFITREHLAGSLGNVGSPIVSRVLQFLGDGMLAYNQARKVTFIPFPFVHAQLSAFAIIVVTLAVPLMMDQYTNEVWLGVLLSFFTVICLAGLHEVARELENPFRNAPNDIPICTLQAMFNETLLTFYAGFHPDSYWDPDEKLPKRPRPMNGKNPATENNRLQSCTESNKRNNLSLPQLQVLIEQQSKQLKTSQEEIDRLRLLVEGNTGKNKRT